MDIEGAAAPGVSFGGRTEAALVSTGLISPDVDWERVLTSGKAQSVIAAASATMA